MSNRFEVTSMKAKERIKALKREKEVRDCIIIKQRYPKLIVEFRLK